MQIIRRIASGAAAVATVGLLAAAPATAAPHEPPPEGAGVVGGARLAAQGVQVAPLAGAPALPADLTGRSWVVADAATGEVLASFNAHAQLPPASTLKMLFADTVLPKLDRTAVHRVAPAELAGLGSGSSLVGVKEDLEYRVEDLWRGVFLSSGNDAVRVLAHMNGGIDRTVAEMQARAQALQARDTRVITPDGYDMDGQVSSAYDLTLFARAGLKNADFRAYCSTRTAQFPGLVDKTNGQRGSFGIANTDKLLGRYPGLIGVKNGYTTNAGATFTGAAERGGRTLLVTVMHTATSPKVYDETAALLDWGFAAAGKVTPVGRLAEDTAAPSPEPAAAAAANGDGQSKDQPSAAPARASAGGSGALGWIGAGLAAIAGTVVLLRRRAVLRRRAAPVPPPAAGEPHPAGATAIRRR